MIIKKDGKEITIEIVTIRVPVSKGFKCSPDYKPDNGIMEIPIDVAAGQIYGWIHGQEVKLSIPCNDQGEYVFIDTDTHDAWTYKGLPPEFLTKDNRLRLKINDLGFIKDWNGDIDVSYLF